VDGEAYFDALARALALARRSVLIAAWEIDDQVSLDPLGRGSPLPNRLGDALRACLDAQPGLRVHVLAWDFAMIYAVERGLQPLFRLRFSGRKRLDFRLDDCHPLGASHHQKLVVVDDAVAFLGGLDLAQHRWDTSDHRAQEPARADDAGNGYAPFHDVQALVEGGAATALGELFRERWRCATGRRLKPPPAGEDPAWPDGIAADLEDAEVGLARTQPAHAGRPEVREVEQLYLDAIAAARRSIYIENQYLTSARVTRALAQRLAQPEAPEVVIVLPQRNPGWLEQGTVGLLRRRRIEELRRADRAGGLRLLYPHVAGVEEGVYVHAKLMVIDDSLLRIGSANLSNRSMGFDSECDLALEACGELARRQAILGLRTRLLAEHLGVAPDDVARTLEQTHGSLTASVDSLAGRSERTLRPLEDEAVPAEVEATLEISESLADPESPEQPERLLEEFVERDMPQAMRTPWLKAALAAAAVAGLLASWRLTPLADWLSAERLASWIEALRGSPLAPLGVAVLFSATTLVLVPITLLIVAAAIVFDPAHAVAYALFGTLAAGSVGFALGRLLGKDLVRRAAGGRLTRISRSVARHGAWAMAAVRLVPLAPFTVVNLVAGASHVRFRDFLAGTALGVAPGILAVVLVEASLEELLSRPGVGSALLLLVVSVLAVAVFAILRRLGYRA